MVLTGEGRSASGIVTTWVCFQTLFQVLKFGTKASTNRCKSFLVYATMKLTDDVRKWLVEIVPN